ncbi:MAG: NYN domain-containing protein [Thermoguttaceae bacterium]
MDGNQRSGIAARPIRAVTYIDGFNLYFGLKTKGYRRYYWLDVERLAENILRPGQQLLAVKYFTADIKAGTDKHRRQQTYLDAMTVNCRKLSIIRGRYLIKHRQCSNCGNVAQIPEEKKTDVNIASHMLVDAFTDRFDVAFLVSGDSDLVPPIEMMRQHHPTVRVIVAFPPGRASDDLKRIAHGWFWINEKTLRISQLPNPVTKPNGYQLHRPGSWK